MSNNQFNNLKSPKGARSKKRIVGRGTGSGHGKTGSRGAGGQKGRESVHPRFEGGQTPLHRRLPVRDGFKNVNHKEMAIINLDDLQNHFEEGAEINPEILMDRKIVTDLKDGIKVLGFGNLEKKLKVTAHGFSKTAEEAIVKAGGEAIRL